MCCWSWRATFDGASALCTEVSCPLEDFGDRDAILLAQTYATWRHQTLCRYCQGRKPFLVEDTVPRWLGLSSQYHAIRRRLKSGPDIRWHSFAYCLFPRSRNGAALASVSIPGRYQQQHALHCRKLIRGERDDDEWLRGSEFSPSYRSSAGSVSKEGAFRSRVRKACASE